ncbi:Abi family protein [Anaerotruncus sp. 1XD22-93]|nr:Abi family protein [Anaerotruncus sp. 1XD42-93]RKJ82936.1 Abi family protein [Anaerotruncus sp. 1XD22-93]
MHHATFIAKLFSLLERSNEIFVLHHKNDLDEIYPFWVAIEVITFDMVSKIFSNLLSKDKTSICSENFLGSVHTNKDML